MPDVSFILLFVDNVERSAEFYARLLEKPVVESSPTFAMLPAGSHLMLGLWRRDGVEPPPGPPGGGEIAISLPDDAAVEATHARWAATGVPIAQKLARKDFGLTFVALDPDGHRLRVFAPG
jgi:catechol 2,3-dioxygenase-like lactoylglutathione lyase family enzyme